MRNALSTRVRVRARVWVCAHCPSGNPAEKRKLVVSKTCSNLALVYAGIVRALIDPSLPVALDNGGDDGEYAVEVTFDLPDAVEVLVIVIEYKPRPLRAESCC